MMLRERKDFLLAWIFIVLFFTVFFSALLGSKQGLLPGLIIGLIVGGVIFIALYFLFGRAMKDTMTDWVVDIKSRPVRRYNLVMISLPFIIIGSGAIYARITYKLFPAFIVTIILSIMVCFFVAYLSEDIKKSKQNGDFIGSVISILFLIIPFSMLFFFFVSILFGFNIDKIKRLF